MRLDHIGYACINQTLRNTKPAKYAVFCGRSLTKKCFTLQEASSRALANSLDLLTILKWNEQHNIRCFRISSDLFPRFTCGDFGYKFEDLPDARAIRYTLKECGDWAFKHQHLLSFHPAQFTTLASPTEKALYNGTKEFLYHNLLCDLIDPDNKLQIDINIHVGGTYGGNFEATSKRFIATYKSLPESAQKRMCLENDDKRGLGGWSTQRLYNLIYQEIGVPLTWDSHHSMFSREEDFGYEEEFLLSKSTWNRPMQVHHSESRFPDKLVPAHSDYYTKPIPSFVTDCDNVYVHLEVKQKELALFKYLNDFSKEIKLA